MHQRTERVASLLMREISQVIRIDFDNHDMGFLTLLRVEVARDIKSARVYYSVMGSEEERAKSDLAIRENAKAIKHLVNTRMNLRYAVDMRFIREEGIDHSFKIQKVLDDLKREREAKDESGES